MSELYHHGIMGQRWGVRRFQNPDGSLTEAGEQRYTKVATSERLIRKDTRDAVALLKKQNKKDAKKAKKLAKKEAQAYDRLKTAERMGSDYETTFYRHLADSLASDGKAYTDRIVDSNAKISSIQDGTLKAGRDFIVQRDYNFWAFPIPMPGGIGIAGSITKERTLIERNKR